MMIFFSAENLSLKSDMLRSSSAADAGLHRAVLISASSHTWLRVRERGGDYAIASTPSVS